MGELQMPRELFTSMVNSCTPGDPVGEGYFRSASPSFALSAANSALRSGSSSLAPKTRESSSMVSSSPS